MQRGDAIRVEAVFQKSFHHLFKLGEGSFELVDRVDPVPQIDEFSDQFS